MKRLRIATMVSGQYATPPPKDVIYAPMDIAIAVSEGLVERGHEVTFFGPVGTEVKGARIETGGLQPLKRADGQHAIAEGPGVRGGELSKIYGLWDQYLLSLMYREALAGKFDVLHVHPVDRALPLALACRGVPTVYTLHDPIFPWRAEIFRMFQSPDQHYVSISDAQRRPAPDLNYAATIYNGIDASQAEFSEKPGEYLLFVGRLNPDKGVAEAIEVAEKTGERLYVLGPYTDSPYWNERIKPHLSDRIKHVGVVPRRDLYSYFRNAKATLFPIQWEEPFGLVMIESLACGAPVIAFGRGSVPEVIEDGRSGFIVKSVDEMVHAVGRIGEIDRWECRRRVENKFTNEKMVAGYEELFLRLAKSRAG